MIRGQHAALRTAEPDDATFFTRLYDANRPRATLLTRLREVIQPTTDELAEVLVQAEKSTGPFYVIEDLEGSIRGFCALRTSTQTRDASFYAELVVLFFDDDDYATPLAEEIYSWLHMWAFSERRFDKMIVHCLDSEVALRAWIAGLGFESCGIQREAMYTLGRWYNIETLALSAEAQSAMSANAQPPEQATA